MLFLVCYIVVAIILHCSGLSHYYSGYCIVVVITLYCSGLSLVTSAERYKQEIYISNQCAEHVSYYSKSCKCTGRNEEVM